MFWNRYHIMLRYQRPYRHQHFRLINGQIRLRYKVQRRYRILLGMGQWRKFPLFYLDILLLLLRSIMFPFLIQFLLLMSEWFKILISNHTLQLLFWLHLRLNRLILLLQYNVLLPNCYLLQFIRKRSYLVWIINRKVQLWLNPWYQVLSP
jgi:hypothetical protein